MTELKHLIGEARYNEKEEDIPVLVLEANRIHAKLSLLQERSVKQKIHRQLQTQQSFPLQQPSCGRPPMVSSTELLGAMNVAVARNRVAAHDRRRNNTVEASLTITQLTKEVEYDLGLPVGRNRVRLHLVPSRRRSRQARRHHSNATIRMSKAAYNKSGDQPDAHGYHCNIKMLRYLAQRFPNYVNYVSRDKKATIPSKGPFVSKQIRRVEQQDSYVNSPQAVIDLTSISPDIDPVDVPEFFSSDLPDHQFDFGSYCVVPNVLLAVQVDETGSLHQNRTYVTLRASTSPMGAVETTFDLVSFLQQNCLAPLFRCNGILKPMLIVSTDNHPDESCWNCPLNRVFALYLKNRFDLDCIVFASPPPKNSKYNPVEHCMSYLSKALVGMVDLHKNIWDDELKDMAHALDRIRYIFERVEIGKKPILVQSYPPTSLDSSQHSVPDLEFLRYGMGAPQEAYNTYFRGRLTDLTNEERSAIERELRTLEQTQKMGHGIFVLTRGANEPWREPALKEYFSQFADCNVPAPIPDPNRPDHMVSPEMRHLYPNDTPVFDTHFFPSALEDDGKPRTCTICNKRVMNQTQADFHNRFFHPTERQQTNQEQYGLEALTQRY